MITKSSVGLYPWSKDLEASSDVRLRKRPARLRDATPGQDFSSESVPSRFGRIGGGSLAAALIETPCVSPRGRRGGLGSMPWPAGATASVAFAVISDFPASTFPAVLISSQPVMESEPTPPEKYVPPPPDLPKPPPPSDRPPMQPPVSVNIKEAGSSEEDGPELEGLAPLNSRILAALIDVVVSVGLYLTALWSLPFLAGKVGWLLSVGYLVTRDSLPFLGGQSIGKKAMKLRAVMRDGKPLTGNWEPALIRNGVLVIPFFGFIELFVLLTREEKPEHGLRLGDEWAKTKVIVEPEKQSPDEEKPE